MTPTNHHRRGYRPHGPVSGQQRGVALLVALVMLLIITLIGIAAARTQTLETRMASNLQNRSIALQSGEAALRFAEGGLLQATYGAFASNANGMYTFDPTMATPWYAGTNVTWSASSTSVITYTGPALSSGAPQAPLFIIEQLPSVAVPGESTALTQYSSGVPPSAVYRITARATGGDTTSTVMLQSIYH